MRRLEAVLIIALLFHTLSISSWAEEFDSIEIKKGMKAGLLSLSFIGSEDQAKMEIEIERIAAIPLIVVINQGSTTFPHGYGEISIKTEGKILVNLSKKDKNTIEVTQTGSGRMRGKMTQASWFTKKTAVVYSHLVHSRDQLLTEIIAALNHEDSWKRIGAAEALGEIGNDRAVTALKETSIDDSDDKVRKSAEDALAKIRNSKELETQSNKAIDSDKK